VDDVWLGVFYFIFSGTFVFILVLNYGEISMAVLERCPREPPFYGECFWQH
jgi:hypothetical protein